MNYFLTYDNASPLFVGGENHGKRQKTPTEWRHCEMAIRRDLGSRPLDYERGFETLACKSERYRQEWFVADGRKFRLFIHESLPVHAALMLMMSMTGEHPDLVKRIAELEAENRGLKKMLAYAVKEGGGGFSNFEPRN